MVTGSEHRLIGVPLSAGDPWAWRPPATSWMQSLGDRISSWQPASSLQLQTGSLADHFSASAGRGEPWVLHPCVSVLALAGPFADELHRDFQLATWIAANGCAKPGWVTLQQPVRMWSPAGGFLVQPGIHDLCDLGQEITRDPPPVAITVDAWCLSAGFAAHQDTWAAAPPASRDESELLQRTLITFLTSLDGLRQAMPRCHAWTASVVRVAVPLRPRPHKVRSGSVNDLPGLIYLDLLDELQILEALVHEAAHLHLFNAEKSGPLVDPRHTATYKSPLRKDPRPLRGILLAYHALIYIAALYLDALHYGVGDPRRAANELRSAQALLQQAQETLLSQPQAFTPAGGEFLASCLDLARYSGQ